MVNDLMLLLSYFLDRDGCFKELLMLEELPGTALMVRKHLGLHSKQQYILALSISLG